MSEWLLAAMLLCGVGGECMVVVDKLGQTNSIEQCRINLDKMYVRIQAEPEDLIGVVGPIDLTKTPRGFCLNKEYPPMPQIEYFYEL